MTMGRTALSDKVRRILTDFDMTTANTQDSMLALCNEKFGTNITTKDLTSWNTEEHVTLEMAKFMWGPECFLNPHVTLRSKPVAGAIAGIQKLVDRGHHVMIVSDRPTGLFDSTRQWLDNNDLDMVRLLFTRRIGGSTTPGTNGLTKLQAAYLYQLDTVIEDAPHHAEAFQEKAYVEDIFLLEMPYNKHVEGNKIHNVTSWSQIVEQLT